jgi:phage tail sheath gpL-like
MVPGVYIQLNLNGSGAGLNSASKRMLLIGYKTTAGSQPSDSVVQVLQQSDANNYFGQGSDLARLYAAALSQMGPGAADVFCLPVDEPSAGTAATHLIAFAGTAATSGSVDVWVCGYKSSVAIMSGDTATILGANVASAINAITDLPVSASASTGTVTLTYKTKGATGNDMPRIVNVNGGTGITASAGTVTITGPASSVGTIALSVGASTAQAAVANADSATIMAGKLVSAINGSANAVNATSSAGIVTLLYARDRVVHRISVSTTGTGLVATVAAGVAGAGLPALTNALTNLAAQGAFAVWCSAFTDTTTLGAMAANIELYANGLNQKGQILHFGATDGLAVAGSIPSATSPALTGSPRYVEVVCPDSPQQAYELAARTGAMVVAEDYQARNYDGKALKTSGNVPMLLPHRVSRLAPSDANAAMYSYHMTPLVVDEQAGLLKVMRGVTTATTPDQRLWDWSFIKTLDYYRYDLGVFLVSRFSGKSLKLTGTPKTSNTITIDSVTDAVFERLKQYDDNDLFDDIESIKSSIRANQDTLVPSRIDIFVPMRPPINLHQLGVVGGI